MGKPSLLLLHLEGRLGAEVLHCCGAACRSSSAAGDEEVGLRARACLGT